ncbi:hypothetical protein RB195_001963 [Necator americanus]|uniref:Uncharacterized protein n=1 Tax=Necator americanus TaxID=51031 RepID=A0ABR1DI86_NECAM
MFITRRHTDASLARGQPDVIEEKNDVKQLVELNLWGHYRVIAFIHKEQANILRKKCCPTQLNIRPSAAQLAQVAGVAEWENGKGAVIWMIGSYSASLHIFT